MTEVARGIFAALLLAMCLGAAVVSIRLAWAERLLYRGDRDSVRQSLALAPGDTRAWEHWAALEPRDAVPTLGRALRLNPYLTSARLDLALRAELAGNRREAERLLLEAFRQDRMFLTRWTLANFYFRSGDEVNFWRWARAAAEYRHSSLSALFDLCHRMSPEASVILDRAIPPRASVFGEYLAYLLSTGRLDAATVTLTRLLEFRRLEDLPVLLAVVDRWLAAGEVARAVAVWNQLVAAGLLPYATLDPAQGRSLTNGNLASKPLKLGFDWRPLWNPEAFISGNRIEFSGRQPDHTEVLWQPLPLAPGGSYTMYYHYRTSGIAPHAGLRWRLLDPGTRQLLALPSPSLSSESETEQTWRFQVPPSAGLGRLTLLYSREPGTPRLEGSLELLEVRLILDEVHSPYQIGAAGKRATGPGIVPRGSRP